MNTYTTPAVQLWTVTTFTDYCWFCLRFSSYPKNLISFCPILSKSDTLLWRKKRGKKKKKNGKKRRKKEHRYKFFLLVLPSTGERVTMCCLIKETNKFWLHAMVWKRQWNITMQVTTPFDGISHDPLRCMYIWKHHHKFVWTVSVTQWRIHNIHIPCITCICWPPSLELRSQTWWINES